MVRKICSALTVPNRLLFKNSPRAALNVPGVGNVESLRNLEVFVRERDSVVGVVGPLERDGHVDGHVVVEAGFALGEDFGVATLLGLRVAGSLGNVDTVEKLGKWKRNFRRVRLTKSPDI